MSPDHNSTEFKPFYEAPIECRGDCAGDGGKASGGLPLRVFFSGAGAGTGQASAGGGAAVIAGGRGRFTKRGAAPRGESSASRLERFGI